MADLVEPSVADTTEGLTDLSDCDYFVRKGLGDHWRGEYTRGSPKGRIKVSWNHVSASQIEAFTKCKRSWYFNSIQKVTQVQKGNQALGEAFHLCMEMVSQGQPWPSHSDIPSLSPDDWIKAETLAKQALPLLPEETKPFKREQGFRMPTYEGGPTMLGYVDLGIPSGVGWPAFLFPAQEAIVTDYKTLSDFRYMKTPAELADSVQMMTYAKWAIEEWPMGLHGQGEPLPEYVRLLHVYARTKPPFNRQSIRHESAIVTPDQINARWAKTLDTVREMEQVSVCGNADQVEANGALNGHCEAYGGCQYRDKCGISKSSGIKTLFSIGQKPKTPEPTTELNLMGSSILEKIKAAQAAAQAKAASATPVTATTTEVAPAANSTPLATVGAVTSGISTSNPDPGIRTQGQETVSPVATTPVSSPAVAKGPISGLLAKIEAKGQGKPMITGSVAQAYAKEQGFTNPNPQGILGSGELGKITVSNLGELVKLSTGVVPPDAPSRAQEVITCPGDTVTDPLKTEEASEDDEDEEDTTEASTAPSAPSANQTTEAPKAKRGRPSREEIAAREAQAKADFDKAVATEVAKRTVGGVVDSSDTLKELAQELEKALAERDQALKDLERVKIQRNTIPAPVSDGLILYVDCFPTKGEPEVTDFFEWIGPICQAVAQSNSVGDYRLINYTAKGLLASAIREVIKAEGTPKAMTISTYSGGADIALEILTPLAKRVIKKI